MQVTMILLLAGCCSNYAVLVCALLHMWMKMRKVLSDSQQRRRHQHTIVERFALLELMCLLLAACESLRLAQQERAARKHLSPPEPRLAVLMASITELVLWALMAPLLRLCWLASQKVPHGRPFPIALMLLLAAKALLAVAAALLGMASHRYHFVFAPKELVPLTSAALQVVLVIVLLMEQGRLVEVIEDERQPLMEPTDLEEGETEPVPVSHNLLSAILFHWVTPLMARGSKRQLQPSDLFPLPSAQQPKECAAVLWSCWQQEQHQKATKSAETGNLHEPSLLFTIARAYGLPYIGLGFLKLAGDILNFAGPLLLSALIRYLSSEEADPDYAGCRPEDSLAGSRTACTGQQAVPNSSWLPATSSPLFGYLCAVALGLTSLLKALLNSHYSYQQGLLSCKLRAAITCIVFKKTLLVSAVDMSAFSTGMVQTLMSVDADRVVNLCMSLHDLWSLPVQIGIALFLLYTQVKYAFLAGLAVVLLLVPVNRWLALKIERASEDMMAYKDVRVKVMAELLRGIHQIKMCVWEQGFVAKVNRARQGELQALAVRKYLDALCVYFWAATSLLFSIVTFGLFVLLGHQLTPEIVFTSLALFNVLIAPLNSLPWVLNGVVEALVSVRRLQRFLMAWESKADWAYTYPAESQDGSVHSSSADRESQGHGSEPFNSGSLDYGTSSHPMHRSPGGTFPSSERSGNEVLPGMVQVVPDGLPSHASQPSPQDGYSVVMSGATFSWVASTGPLTDPHQAALQRRVGHGRGKETSSSDAGVQQPLLPSLRKGSKQASGLVQPQVNSQPGPTLQNISLTLSRGSLTVLHGEVGAGKSSLLAALLGEMEQQGGHCRLNGRAAYVGQQAWVMSGSLRSNVLLGQDMDSDRYSAVLEACALTSEVAAMPHKDLTLVGERGTTLSGGQRVRLALARAVYQDCDVYMLDDVLSAVDAHVANWLVKHLIQGPLLADRTRIVATHSELCMAAANQVVKLFRGKIVSVESPEAALGHLQSSAWGLEGHADAAAELSGVQTQGTRGGSSLPASGLRTLNMPSQQQRLPGLLHEQVSAPSLASAGPLSSVSTLSKDNQEAMLTPVVGGLAQALGDSGTDLPAIIAATADTSPAAQICLAASSSGEMQQEQRQIGHVRWAVYASYGRAVGLRLALLIFLSLLLMQASRNANDLWLSFWVSHVEPQAPSGAEHALLSPVSQMHTSALITVPAQAPARLETALSISSFAPLTSSFQHMHSQLSVSGSNSSWPPRQLQSTHLQLSTQSPAEWRPVHFISKALAQAAQNLQFAHSALTPDVKFYLYILVGIAAANSVFTLVRAFSFAFGGLVAAQCLHEQLLQAVISARCRFFDITSAGRVLNRFSSDTATVDDALPFIMNILFANMFGLAGILVVLCLSQPLLLPALLPLGLIFRYLQQYYRQTAREIRRLSNTARSPVYATFSEALDGAVTIRAFGAQKLFADLNEQQVAALQQASFAGIATAQWLGLRLQLIAAVLVTLVGVMAIAGNEDILPGFHGAGEYTASLLGLSLSYALPITGLLSAVLSSSAETEQEMVSVERIQEYSQLEPEACQLLPCIPARGPSECTPASEDLAHQSEAPEQNQQCLRHHGASPQAQSAPPDIDFIDVHLTYNKQGLAALMSVSLHISSGLSYGICGRTGAGKSSLIAALLRLTEISKGQILLGGRDTRQIPLPALRQMFGVVPQTPFLFQGTVRENLDPMKVHRDRDMIAVLRAVQLWDILCGIGLSLRKTPIRPVQAVAARMPMAIAATSSLPIGTPPRSPLPARTMTPPHVGRMSPSPRTHAGLMLEGSGTPPIPFRADSRVRVEPLESDSVLTSGQAERPRSLTMEPDSPLAQIPKREGAESGASQRLSSSSRAGAESSRARQPPAGMPQLSGRGRSSSPLRATVTPRTAARSGASMDPSLSRSRLSLGVEDMARTIGSEFGGQLLSLKLGEGISLSQGQQQLLCLARVLLARPSIVILDECTANVDQETSRVMHELLATELRGCTIIQVAHRLDSVMECDVAIVMDGGNVVEQGAPQKLLQTPDSALSNLWHASKAMP